jgi:hypothetical protein
MMRTIDDAHNRALRSVVAVLSTIVVASMWSCAADEKKPHERAFDAPEAAAETLIATVKSGNTSGLLTIFGPDAQDLIQSSDPVTARRNREVFTIAVGEQWHLADSGPDRKSLVIGHEQWPFPIPLVKDAGGWRFDTQAGKEEVLARRIGRNELAVIQICRTYVTAQRVYANHPHDGKPSGIYAATFTSDPGRQNGLYWPASEGQLRSPLGDLVARAADEGQALSRNSAERMPFHGYYFKILTAQGSSAPGGAKDYVVGGAMTGGFALVAVPAEYDLTGIMTFIINHEGILYQKDLGPESDQAVRRLTLYDPDSTWAMVQ